jgi:ribosomal protein S18 acetylase RimI-like enzyme
MTIEPLQHDDIAAFLKIASAENWVAEPWEFTFLLSVFPAGCFCMRDNAGKAIAFVTSLQHENSGWIGNLIVAEEFRDKGIGDALFRKALEALQATDAETFWLTASNAGKSLYEKYGFSGLDTVVRWSGTGRRRHSGNTRQVDHAGTSTLANSIDCQAWGDRRDALLAATAGRGRLLQENSGFMVLQPCGADVQIGPFSALDSGTAEVLFETALRAIPLGTKVFLDAPVSNRSALRMFNRRGMRIAGRNELMYAGVKPDYRPEMLYGLATMGSCG